MKRRFFLWMGLSVLFTSLAICGDLPARETYKVQRGDTLSAIAGKTGVTPRALQAANRLKGDRLKADQTLIIPSPKIKKNAKSARSSLQRGEVYVVQQGETLSGIARKTGVSIAGLREINHFQGSALSIGQKLSLKKPESATQPPLPAGETEDDPETEWADDDLDAPDDSWAEIEELKKENAALLGKWSNPDEPKLLVKAAMGFLGAPYRFGGFSAKGIDCSGLVKKIYQLFDIDLPRTANEQSRVGMRVARSDLSEGDLLFFNTRRTGGHVGIYIGNNEFVHAASRKRGVRVDSLDKPYFKKRFIRAMRLKGSDDDL